MKKIGILFVALVFVVGVSSAFAGYADFQNWASEKAAAESYGDKAVGMAVKGLDQAVTSPLELVDPDNYQEGFLRGLGTGAGNFVSDLGKGIINVVGALFPDFRGI